MHSFWMKSNEAFVWFFYFFPWIFPHQPQKLCSNVFLTLEFSFVATAVEDDDDDDEDEESDGFSDNENSEEMVDEENKDFGLKSLLEEDENKKSQVRIPDWHPSIYGCAWQSLFLISSICYVHP